MAKNIYLEIFFLYQTSWTHDYHEGKGWTMHFKPQLFISRLLHFLFLRTILNHKEKLYVSLPRKTINKNKKVVHLIGKIGGIGGSQKVIFDLITYLGEKYSMEIITLTDYMLYEYPGLNVKVILNKASLYSYLISSKPNIVHMHYYGDWYGFHDAITAIFRLKGVRIIENINTLIPAYKHPMIDDYVYVSEAVQQINQNPPGKVIYPGVDTEEYIPYKKNKRKIAGFVYRLFKDKLSVKSFEALVEIAKKDPEIKIIIVGYGEYFKKYFDIVRKNGVRNQFEFVGKIEYAKLPEYYRKFSIFLAPVIWESYGLVVPYAMAMNMPVVAMNTGALPEILGVTNYLAKDFGQFIDIALKSFANPVSANKKASGGRERVLERFSINKMIEDYDNLYSRLLK